MLPRNKQFAPPFPTVAIDACPWAPPLRETASIRKSGLPISVKMEAVVRVRQKQQCQHIPQRNPVNHIYAICPIAVF
jgi:hypothetical protein